MKSGFTWKHESEVSRSVNQCFFFHAPMFFNKSKHDKGLSWRKVTKGTGRQRGTRSPDHRRRERKGGGDVCVEPPCSQWLSTPGVDFSDIKMVTQVILNFSPLTRRATSNYARTGHHWKSQTQRWGWCMLLDQRQKRTAVVGMRSGDTDQTARGQHRAPLRGRHCSFPAAERPGSPALLDASSEANRGLNMWEPQGLGLSAANAQIWMDRVPAWGSIQAELSWQFCLMWVPMQQAKASWGVSQRWGSKFTAPLNCWVWLPSWKVQEAGPENPGSPGAHPHSPLG